MTSWTTTILSDSLSEHLWLLNVLEPFLRLAICDAGWYKVVYNWCFWELSQRSCLWPLLVLRPKQSSRKQEEEEGKPCNHERKVARKAVVFPSHGNSGWDQILWTREDWGKKRLLNRRKAKRFCYGTTASQQPPSTEGSLWCPYSRQKTAVSKEWVSLSFTDCFQHIMWILTVVALYDTHIMLCLFPI